MLIRVTQVVHAENKTIVEFTCTVGEGKGVWPGAPPSVGDQRHVELDAQGPEGGLDIALAQANRPRVRTTPKGVEITAKLTQTFADGTAWFNFADGRLWVEMESRPRLIVGTWYVLTTKELSIADMNL
jgi:hypothetical protein